MQTYIFSIVIKRIVQFFGNFYVRNIGFEFKNERIDHLGDCGQKIKKEKVIFKKELKV